MSLLPDRKISISIVDSYGLISYVLTEETSVCLPFLCACPAKKMLSHPKSSVSSEAEAGRENHIVTFAKHSGICPVTSFSPIRRVCLGQGLYFSLSPSFQLFPNGLHLHTEPFLISAWWWAERFLKSCCLWKLNRTFWPDHLQFYYTSTFLCGIYLRKGPLDVRDLVLEN